MCESPAPQLVVKISHAADMYFRGKIWGRRSENIDLPSPVIARPNKTPASSRTAAGDLESGGPGSELSFSKVS
jgi:hypothetical protein